MEKQESIRVNPIYASLFILGFVAAILVVKCREKPVQSFDEVLKVLQEEHEKERDDIQREITTIKTSYSDYQTYIAALESEKNRLKGISDRRLNSMQELKKQLEEANLYAAEKDLELRTLIAIVNESKYTTVDTLIVRDTIINTRSVAMFNNYHKEPSNWFSISTNVFPESRRIDYDLSVRNSFSIQEFDDRGESFVRVINDNPYTITAAGSNIFQLKPRPESKPKRFGVGPFFGVDDDLSPSFGIGIHYSLLRF